MGDHTPPSTVPAVGNAPHRRIVRQHRMETAGAAPALANIATTFGMRGGPPATQPPLAPPSPPSPPPAPAAAGDFPPVTMHEARLPSRQPGSAGAAVRAQRRASGRDGAAHGRLWPPPPPVTCSRLRLARGQRPARCSGHRAPLSSPTPLTAPAPQPARRGGVDTATSGCRCSSLHACAAAPPL